MIKSKPVMNLCMLAERIMRFLPRIILVIAATHLCRYSSTATYSDNALRDKIFTDIQESICYMDLLGKLLLYFSFCEADGFDQCDEEFHSQYGYFSIDCDTKCSNQTDLNLVWNVHILSENYNITVQCQNNICTGINNYTKLLNIEQDFTMQNNTLRFFNDFLYEDSLVGCIATANNCTENHFWIVDDLGATGGLDVRISSPVNGTTYYAALGENLTVTCQIDGDVEASVTWNKSNASVNQYVQLGYCLDFDINNKICILPSLHLYKEARVRSRLLTTQVCQLQFIKDSILDIPIVNWTDNGLSYKCISKRTDTSNTVDVVHINVVVDAIPKFIHQLSSYSEQNTTIASYSCVVQGGLSAKVQWSNSRGDVIPERSENDTNPPSIYVTYSMYNVSTVFSANNFSYTGEPINSEYPIHNVTLHYNKTLHNGNNTFTCAITGMNREFLKQYNITNDNLTFLMTVYTNDTSLVNEQISAHTEKTMDEIAIMISITGVILIVAFILLITLLYYGRRRQLRKKKVSIQAPFEILTAESALNLSNSSKALFPRDKVALLEVIREGNFGVVWKARAEGIVENAPHLNIVAVKTTKDALNVQAIDDLGLELIILSKITPHLNICNLLGFCNSENESPYILLEYCLFGKLKDYLQSCDDALVKLGLPVELSDYPDGVQGSSHSLEYVNILQSNCNCYNSSSKILNKDSPTLNVPSDSGYGDSIVYVPESIDSGYIYWSIGGDSSVPVSRDYTNSPGILYNQDITNFALQIAHGLQHLENLKIYHGDLSARNILIAKGFILKIADFGHARELGTQEYYRRQSQRPLPVKWMAIESLKEESLCTHKSDMWSYGVLLWEIATYGKSPYDGLANTDVLQHLQEGNRLPCPNGCSQFWYDFMLKCWSENTNNRPSASQVVEQLSKPSPRNSTSTILGLTTAV